MKRIEFELYASDNLKLFGHSWQPDTEAAKASVVLVHGMGEHIMRYDHWAEKFVNKGYAVTSMDHRGHGRSEGKRGHIPSYESLLQDVDMLIKKSLEFFPKKPIILYGHSLGGNIVLNHALTRKNISRYIVTSPWLQLSFKPSSIKLVLAKAMKRILPGLLQPSGLNIGNISHDPEVVKAYENDPLVHDRISVRMFISVYTRGEWALANAGKLDRSVLLMHGGDDKITSSDASRRFAEKAGKNVELKIWEGMYHELHNEKIKDEVFGYIIDWLKKQELA
ncbi:MAG: alpha/beta hydrolase [Bacteroidetes bacterium]|nr:alpha/beta hydrolase [Bacteroidota bacterium]